MSASAAATRRVLVVDDDGDLSTLLVEALASMDIVASTAKNGRDALEQLAGGLRPDVILLDLMMPEMDGWEFRRRQRERPELAAIPVIVLSADGQVAENAAKIAAEGFVPKPPSFDALANEIERVLALTRDRR